MTRPPTDRLGRQHFVQPRLMTAWGVEFHGKAETYDGRVWWHEEQYPDGSRRRLSLVPMYPTEGDRDPTPA